MFRYFRFRYTALGCAALAIAGACAGTADASTTPGQYDDPVSLSVISAEHPVPGLTYETVDIDTSLGQAVGYVLIADTDGPHESVGLVHAPYVADRDTPTDLAAENGAYAAINADMFDIDGLDHSGYASESADGPEILNGKLLKGAVPLIDRYGPAETTGGTGEEVIGVGDNGLGQVNAVKVVGTIKSKTLTTTIAGYNQFAIPQGGIDVFDSAWGSSSRARATCGTDTSRNAACLTSGVTEVIVRDGRVVSVSDQAGSGQLPRGEVALVGREAGAAELAQLKVGEPVNVKWHAKQEDSQVPLRWAVGGIVTLANGQLVAGLGTNTTADLNPTTGAGISKDGKKFYLLVIDGRTSTSIGASRITAAQTLLQLGAYNGVGLDESGSSQIVMRSGLRSGTYNVLNTPSDGQQRPVPNGIGVFVHGA